MANWVRFADTKATVLAAGFGVVVTMMTSQLPNLLKAFKSGPIVAVVLGLLVLVTIVALCWTLGWLMVAILPRKASGSTRINRFAWPTLMDRDYADVKAQLGTTAPEEDAWHQTLNLTAIAKRKFAACTRAIVGFAVLVMAGLISVILASIVSNWG